MKVTLDRDDVVRILNDSVSRELGRRMKVLTEWNVNGDINMEPVIDKPTEKSAATGPVLTTALSQAAQEVEEEVSL